MMSSITDTTKEAILDTHLKEHLDENITKWNGLLNGAYRERTWQSRGDTDDPIIDYIKGTLNAYISIRTFLREQDEKQ